jgi:predicted TIM-barrel fold metal-dependent hydrolase
MSIENSTPNPSPMVDAHAHVFTADMPLRDKPRHAPTYDFTVEDYLKVLDAHGVGFAVLAAASPWLDYNDYLIDCVRRNPRLRGTVILQPSVERYVMQAMDADGIIGVRLHMIGLETMPDITTFEYRRTFRRIADLGWHIHLHAEGKDLPELLPLLERTGATLVVDHLGRPDPKGGIDSEGFKAMVRSVEKGRTWVKASGAYRLGLEKSSVYLKELIRLTGPDKLVWGSDCPFVGVESTTYQSTIDWFLQTVTDPAQRAKILGLNALKLYFAH